ncbi:hypothetical protein EG329_006086 [Mollisiaceae sp. DMI_Dod_QoI]|nr:hypothetical protein EG329_006086 [Helotiales sp. DMI_Dod_QoI]
MQSHERTRCKRVVVKFDIHDEVLRLEALALTRLPWNVNAIDGPKNVAFLKGNDTFHDLKRRDDDREPGQGDMVLSLWKNTQFKVPVNNFFVKFDITPDKTVVMTTATCYGCTAVVMCSGLGKICIFAHFRQSNSQYDTWAQGSEQDVDFSINVIDQIEDAIKQDTDQLGPGGPFCVIFTPATAPPGSAFYYPWRIKGAGSINEAITEAFPSSASILNIGYNYQGAKGDWSDDTCFGMLRIVRQDCAATNIEVMSATGVYGSSATLANLWVYRRLAPLPKRVINIGSASKDAIRLVETSSIQSAYIALSHCWGGHQPIKTTSSSLAQMQANIEWSDLSRVFQDAIIVARRLDIEWIWIDSLCIIQDSKVDWQVESAKMCDYYSNAYLTISASSSKNGTVPFLQERGSQWQTQKFPFSCTDGREVEILARRHTGSSMAQLVEDLSPLASRARCWQENVLSTRVLHYAQSELIFECKTEVISEDGAKPRGFYTMGLAQKLSSGGGEKKKILSDADYVSTDDSPILQSKTYLAPSWSWASVNGALNFVSPDQNAPFTCLVTVLDVHVSVSGLNKYGEVQDGYLLLKGMVSKVRIICIDPSDCWGYTVGEDPMTREPIAPDCALQPYETRSENDIREVTLRRAKKGDMLVPFEVDVYCVHIGKQVSDDDVTIYCMVIAPSHVGDGTYIRIGLIQIDDETWFEEEAVEMTIEIQ